MFPPQRDLVSNRQLVLQDTASAPLPRVRTAAGKETTIFFDAPIRGDSLQVEGDGTRVQVLDTDDKNVIVQPPVELGEAGVLLRVGFVDGAAPSGATLVLVSDPGHVDSSVRVNRHARAAHPR